MRTLLIVQHSLTGGTLQMARAAADGARQEGGVTVRLLQPRKQAPMTCCKPMATSSPRPRTWRP